MTDQHPDVEAGRPDGPASDPGRRRRPLVLVPVAVAALLVAGGAVGCGTTSSGSAGATSSVVSDTASPAPSPGAAAAPTGSVEAVAQEVLPSVVQLRGASGEGSGVSLSADGLFLSHAHVLEAGRPGPDPGTR